MKPFRFAFPFLPLFFCSVLWSQTLPLAAHYPLNCTPNDTTGNFDPMQIDSLEYVDNALFFTGQYYKELAMTPVFPATMYQALQVSVKFKLTEYPTIFRPVIVCGGSYRWLGVVLDPDTTIDLLHTNAQHVHSTVHYQIDRWHDLLLTYDTTTLTGAVYLDGVPAASATFPIDHGTNDFDQRILACNPSNASSFKGYMRDLKVYMQLPATGVAEEASLPARPILHQNYPNPFSGSTEISWFLPAAAHVRLSIRDMLGREVAVPVDRQHEAGMHRATFTANALIPGVYTCVLEAGKANATREIVLIR